MHAKIEMILTRLDRIEQKLYHDKPQKEPFQKQLVKNVSSIIGLEAAVTNEYRSLRCIWCVILALGFIATGWFVYSSTSEFFDNATVTKVEVKRMPTYEYPQVVLCPTTWLNADKALSLGLSFDALIYSLGYFQHGYISDLTNASAARGEFLKTYDRLGHRSLYEYYKSIAIDLVKTNTVYEFAKASMNSSVICYGCSDSRPPSKWYLDGRVCYRFDLCPRDDNLHKSTERRQRQIVVRIADLAKGIFRATSEWSIFVIGEPADMVLSYHTGSSLNLAPFTVSTIRLSAQRKILLRYGDIPCADENQFASDYSSESCYARCLSEQVDKPGQCELFYESVGRISSARVRHPTEFCNAYDIANITYWERLDYMRSYLNDSAHVADFAKCERRCPQKCDRMIYEISLRSQVDEAHSDQALQKAMGEDRTMNMSVLVVKIEHGALYEGGIMTITEINTYTFSTLISNLGGALGLFVGATMMTFVQVIMFAVKLLLDKFWMRSSSHSCH